MMKKFLIKNIQYICIAFTLAILLPGCETQEILVPEIEFFIAKEWKIQEAYRDGALLTKESLVAGENLEVYRLKIYEDFTFDKIDVYGQLKRGNWALTSGLTQLVLFADEPETEHWLILDLKVRRLELKYEVPSLNKPNIDSRLVLVPVKGQ